MTTLADVAAMAGVSASTVSHVINRTRPVAEATRARVLAAVDATGYVPNEQARSLVRARSQQLGLAISMMSNPYVGELVHAIERAASAEGFTLLLGDTHEDPQCDEQVVAALRARRVDGLLLAPSAGSSATLDRLAVSGIPTVLVDRCPDPRFDAVCSENVAPMADLVAHLGAAGHRRIALVSGREGLTTTLERISGYRLGLQRCGLTADPALMVRGGSDTETTFVAVAALLDAAKPPTAIVAANNTMVIATMRVLRERGLRVPEDVAVVGFDDFEWADVFSPRLTTIAQDYSTMGRLTVDRLLARIQHRGTEPQTYRVPATVMHRDSCGCGSLRVGGARAPGDQGAIGHNEVSSGGLAHGSPVQGS